MGFWSLGWVIGPRFGSATEEENESSNLRDAAGRRSACVKSSRAWLPDRDAPLEEFSPDEVTETTWATEDEAGSMVQDGGVLRYGDDISRSSLGCDVVPEWPGRIHLCKDRVGNFIPVVRRRKLRVSIKEAIPMPRKSLVVSLVLGLTTLLWIAPSESASPQQEVAVVGQILDGRSGGPLSPYGGSGRRDHTG